MTQVEYNELKKQIRNRKTIITNSGFTSNCQITGGISCTKKEKLNINLFGPLHYSNLIISDNNKDIKDIIEATGNITVYAETKNCLIFKKTHGKWKQK